MSEELKQEVKQELAKNNKQEPTKNNKEPKQEVKQVTAKHEGRVRAGKKLAAWNKKQKEDLRKNLVSGDQEPTSPHKSMDNTYIYGVGTLAVLALGVGVWYKFTTTNGGESHRPAVHPEVQQDKRSPPPSSKQQIDFFKMKA